MELRGCRFELIHALRDEFGESRVIGGITDERRMEIQRIIYYVGDTSEHDALTPQINSAIEKIEKVLRPLVSE